MSAYYQGITFANQRLSPANDAVIRRRLIADGLLTGCEISHTRDTMSMAPGYLMACGRQIRHPSAEDWKVTYSPATSKTASGAVIALSDASDGPLQDLRIYGKTTQDGTPTPEAPVEMVSVGDGGSIVTTVAGKNLVKEVRVLSSATQYRDCLDVKMDCLQNNTVYTISFIAAAGHKVYVNENLFKGYNALTGTGERKSITLITKGTFGSGAYDGEWVIILKNNAGNEVTPNFADVQIELGETATNYAPYSGQTLQISTPNGLPGIPVTSGGNYTDANGQQWICDEVDFARGVYVQRMALLDNFRLNGTLTETDMYLCKLGSVLKETTKQSAICTVTDKYNYSNGDNVHFYIENSTKNLFVYVPIGFDNSEKVIKVLAALETPIETPIPEDELAAYAAIHTNKPNTTIYNDAGAHMEVGYYPQDDTIPSSGYARVLMTIDMTRTSTEEVFDQVNTSIEYAGTEDGFPVLVQDDINNGGSVYQLPLAVVKIDDGIITGITDSIGNAEPI